MPLILRECPVCLKESSVYVTDDDLFRYNAGALVQDAMPDLNADQREIFMTGIHPACWPVALGSFAMHDIEDHYVDGEL